MWDQHAVWSRRLSDVQAELRTRSPYRDEVQDTLVRQAQDYYRDLIGDSFASLPNWALDQQTADRPWMDRYHHEGGWILGNSEIFGRTCHSHGDCRCNCTAIWSDSNDSRRCLGGNAWPSLGSSHSLFGRLYQTRAAVLLATADEEVASRVRAHHGWVCHLKDIVRAKVAPPSSNASSMTNVPIGSTEL